MLRPTLAALAPNAHSPGNLPFSKLTRTTLGLAALTLTSLPPAGAARPQSDWVLDTLLQEGQTQPGLGTLVRPTGGAFNNQGDWAAHAIVTPEGLTTRGVVIKNGALVIGDGDPLSVPPGATLGTLATNAFAFGPALDERGDIFWNGTFIPDGGFPVACIGRNDGVLLTPFESELNPGGPVWVDFFTLQVRGEGELLVGGRISDPLVPFPFRTVLAQVQVDASGQVSGSTVLAELDEPDPAWPGTLAQFSTWNTGFTLGADDAFAWTGALDVDGAELEAVGRDGTLLAIEGAPAGALGEWLAFDPAGVALGPSGLPAWRGTVLSNGPSQQVLFAIFVAGAVTWVSGEALPGDPDRAFIAPLVSPMQFANDGRLALVLEWEQPGVGTGESLYLGDEPIMEVGDTTVEGHVIDQLFEGYRAMDGRDDGGAFIVNGRTSLGDNSLFRARRAGQVDLLVGCTTPAAELRATEGGPQIGEPLALEVKSDTIPSAALFLGIGPPGVGPLAPCGPLFPGIGELLLDPLQFSLQSLGSAALPASVEVSVPFVPELIGQSTALQALLVDSSGQAQLTNGLSVTLGG